MKSQWLPISSAPKDGKPLLVEDSNATTSLGANAPWVAAKWLEGEEWSGWIYEDELLNDHFPMGPQPRWWFDLPPIPNKKC